MLYYWYLRIVFHCTVWQYTGKQTTSDVDAFLCMTRSNTIVTPVDVFMKQQLLLIRGFVKLKKFQKSEKNSEVGGWVKPQLGSPFFWGMLCFLCRFYFPKCFKKKKLGRGVGGWCLINPSFSRIFGFFLTWQDPLAQTLSFTHIDPVVLSPHAQLTRDVGLMLWKDQKQWPIISPKLRERPMFVKCTREHETLNQCGINVNPLTAKLFNLNVHPLEFVSRWRDPQLQVSENYSDLTKWRSTLSKYCWLMSHFLINTFKIWYLMC